jgi:hypothetical protein
VNRRAFLTTLGGVISAVAARPVMALVPTSRHIQINDIARLSFEQLIELQNAFAFAWVAQVNERHEVYYRARALDALRRYREGQS